LTKEVVEILWMDGVNAKYYVDSASLNSTGTVLNLYEVLDFETRKSKPDLHLPITNIRHWSKN